MAGQIEAKPEEKKLSEAASSAVRNVEEIERLLSASREGRVRAQNRIPDESRKMFEEFSGIVQLRYDRSEFSRFFEGADSRAPCSFSALPALSENDMKKLKGFLSESRIKLLHEEDLEGLAKGERFIIGGVADQAPSGEEIKRLQKQHGIYVGVYDDGRIYISNRAGYLMQKLANNGISMDMLPSGDALIYNNLYAPAMDKALISELESGLALARKKIQGGDIESAVKISGIIENIINGLRLAQDYDTVVRDSAPYSGVKLTRKEWESLKKEFSGEEFREISGSGTADFEKAGLSLGLLAEWHATRGREIALGAAKSYRKALGAFLRGAGTDELERAQEECARSSALLQAASLDISKAGALLSSIGALYVARKAKEEFSAFKIPKTLGEEMPDIIGPLEQTRQGAGEALESIETYSKYMSIYALAALDYSAKGDSAGLERIDSKIRKTTASLQKVADGFEEKKERFFETINQQVDAVNFRREIKKVQQKLSEIRYSVDSAALDDAEKDMMKGIFIHGANITFEDADRMLATLYERGRASDLLEDERYKALFNAIEFAHPFTWRYRLSAYDAGPRMTTMVKPKAGVLERMKEERLSMSEGEQKRRLEILNDAYTAVERLKMFVKPQRSAHEAPMGKPYHGEYLNYHTVVERNATAKLEDEIASLEKRFGDRNALSPSRLRDFGVEFASVYKEGCAGVAGALEDRAFEQKMAELPWYREFLARTARVLDKHGEAIMWTAAGIGVIAGIFDSAGIGSVAEGAVARKAAGEGILFLARRYGIAGIRGAASYLGVSGRVLALSSAGTSGLMYLSTAGLSQEESNYEREMARSLLSRSIQYGVYGLISSYPSALSLARVSPALYARVGMATNALVFGGAAFNVYNLLTEKPPESMTPAEEYAWRTKKALSFGDVFYLSLAIGIPALRFSSGFVRGLRGFSETGLLSRSGSAAKFGFKEAFLDLGAVYKGAVPAFSSGDIVMTGFFASDPFLMAGFESVFAKDVDKLMSPKERELAEMRPRRISAENMEKPIMGALGEDAVLPLSLFLEMRKGKK